MGHLPIHPLSLSSSVELAVSGKVGMATIFPNLSSAISRLNPIYRPSLYLTIRGFNKLGAQQGPLRPARSILHASFKSFSAQLSSSNFNPAMAQIQNQLTPDENLVVLGIETSCDDTAAAVVNSNGEILSQVISSQSELLAKYGGVAPKMAEEAHAQAIDQVVQDALDKAKLTEKDLTAVAVTIGPGLSLCLRVGVQKARRIAGAHSLPIVGVHHMEAHTLVARLVERKLQFPFMALLVSGGHNLLILARGLGDYIQLGTTVDDAIGEAYDKTAKWLGLDLRKSGGPAIEKLALEGDAESVKFNVPMKQHKDCNFSYAGLKTQVRLAIEAKNINAGIPISSASSEDRKARADIAASFQVVSGGVASNQYVRARLNEVVKKNGLQLVCPPPSLCTDNGVMVAWTGIEHFLVGRFDPPPPADEPEDALVDLRPRWPLGEEYAEGKNEARSLKTARVHPSLTSLIQASRKQQSESAV
nr:probable tRNA N6-adenosine threonylcarbamoyltransferase, mitochondrial [Ipomoea trifida]